MNAKASSFQPQTSSKDNQESSSCCLDADADAFVPPANLSTLKPPSVGTDTCTSNARHDDHLNAKAKQCVTSAMEPVPLALLQPNAQPFLPSTALNGRCLSKTAIEFVPGISRHQPNLSNHKSESPIARTPICTFFAGGACRKGLDCPFLHTITEKAKDCPAKETNNNARSIEEGVTCKFGPGLSIVSLLLSSVAATIVLSGLPLHVSNYNVEARLSPFGPLMSLSVQKGANSESYATATFQEPTMALAAARALHGSAVTTWVGQIGDIQERRTTKPAMNHGAIVVSVRIKDAGTTTSSGASVKVQWYKPSRSAWVHFSQRWQAEKAARACNRMAVGERCLTAKFQPPAVRQKCSFSVWIGNIDEFTTPALLRTAMETQSKCPTRSITFAKLSFKGSDAPGIVQKLLSEGGGPLVSFNCLAGDKGAKRKALAKFASEADAQRACRLFNKSRKVSELGGSALLLQQVFSVKYSLPSPVVETIIVEIHAAIAKIPSARIGQHTSRTETSVSVQTDDAEALALIRKEIDPLLSGEVVRVKNGLVFWNTLLVFESFLDQMAQEIGREATQSVWCDNRRHLVRIFGPLRSREKTMKQVIEFCGRHGIETHAVPISRATFEKVLRNGRAPLEKLAIASSARKVSLNLKSNCLLVEGSAENARRAKSLVPRILEEDNKNRDSDASCPVCFCEPDSSVSLSCKHEYCRACFSSWLTGSNLCSFPLTCLAEGCDSRITLAEVELHLQAGDLEKLLRAAMDDHIRRNIANFQFCPAPTCPGIYKTETNGGESVCSTCSLIICLECKASHHPMPCAVYTTLSLPVDKIRLKIVDEILTLRCPRCDLAFLDFDGCFALACSVCPCRFCGWCLSDCGHDAHPHVAVCPKKENSETYFGTKEQFVCAQNKTRRSKLTDFLSLYPVDERADIVTTISKDLKDLKLSL